MAGLASARAHGRMGGRSKKLEEGQVKVVIALANEGELTSKESEQVKCSRSACCWLSEPQLLSNPSLISDNCDRLQPGADIPPDP